MPTIVWSLLTQGLSLVGSGKVKNVIDILKGGQSQEEKLWDDKTETNNKNVTVDTSSLIAPIIGVGLAIGVAIVISKVIK